MAIDPIISISASYTFKNVRKIFAGPRLGRTSIEGEEVILNESDLVFTLQITSFYFAISINSIYFHLNISQKTTWWYNIEFHFYILNHNSH